jgi:hypothetical protein
LLQICKFFTSHIKNEIIDVNEDEDNLFGSIYVRTILDFVNMITLKALNEDKEIIKFFFDERYLPIILLLEFLKREKIN